MDSPNKHIRQAHLGENESLQALLWSIEKNVINILDIMKLDEWMKDGYVEFLKNVSTTIESHFAEIGWEFEEYKIRIRITDRDKAKLTCKGKLASEDGLKVNEEFDITIPVPYAYFLLSQVSKGAKLPIGKMWQEITWVTKRRHKVTSSDGKIWDLDQYLGANRSIRTADIELDSATEDVIPLTENMLPLTKKTSKPYKNKKLQKNPYRRWTQLEKNEHTQKV